MDVDELQSRYRSERDLDIRERILMIIWLKKDKTTYEIADLLDCPQSKVMYWKARFEKEGFLADQMGPRSYLSGNRCGL